MFSTNARRPSARIGVGQLFAMTTTSILRTLERAIIHVRLNNSAKAVEVLARKAQNDHAAIAAGYDGPAIRRQIAQHACDIAEEQALQARLTARLVELQA